MQQFDLLTSYKSVAALVNCKVTEDSVLCGVAYFEGGLPSTIPLFSEGFQICLILVPDEIRQATTFTLITDPSDLLSYQKPKLLYAVQSV